MKRIIPLVAAVFLLLVVGCLYHKKNKLPYKDKDKSIETRVRDLLNRMTLQEKTAQLQNISFSSVSNGPIVDSNKLRDQIKTLSYGCGEGMGLSVEEYTRAICTVQKYLQENNRLGIPILTSSEAIHGCVHKGSTIFPQAIAQGSTFNPVLINRMAGLIADEVKAQGTTQVLSPDLDLARELRWGRVEETYGEDPYLVSQMGVAFVHAFNEHKIICTPKHYVAHGTPRGGLNLASVAGGERELRSIYLKPFEKVIKDAKPLSLMNAYSVYDGQPLATSHFLLTDILRGELGFNGYVYSDWGSIEMLESFHKTAANKADAALQAIKAGLDLEVWSDCFMNLDSLVINGVLPVRYIDTAVSRVLKAKFLIGLFDNPLPDTTNLMSKIHTPENIQMSLQVARESAVLLKNENSILPLSDKINSLAVIGPSANQVQFGDYSWTNENKYGITPLQGISHITDGKVKLNYAMGCDHYSQDKSGFDEAVTATMKSDAAIIFIGSKSASPGYPSPNATSGESFDLSDLKLPGVQEELIRKIYETGKPVIVVLVSGKPFAIPWVKENIPAVIVQWYAGEQGGNAIAEILFGKTNPSGKLNVSFPQSVGHLPVYYNHYPSDKGYYNVRGTPEKPGKDYVFSSPDPLWAFGSGLSYTTFEYQEMELSKVLLSYNDVCNIKIKVKNTGNVDGKEVVQLYVNDLVSSVETPVLELKRFEKIFIKAGETATVNFTLPIEELAIFNQKMEKVVEQGEFSLFAGSASNQLKLKQTIRVMD